MPLRHCQGFQFGFLWVGHFDLFKCFQCFNFAPLLRQQAGPANGNFEWVGVCGNLGQPLVCLCPSALLLGQLRQREISLGQPASAVWFVAGLGPLDKFLQRLLSLKYLRHVAL